MFDNAAPLDFFRLAIVIVAFSINVSAIFAANQDLRFVVETNDATLLVLARRNVRREYLRCFRQFIVLWVSATALFVSSVQSPLTSLATLALTLLSVTNAAESIWERTDRRLILMLDGVDRHEP